MLVFDGWQACVFGKCADAVSPQEQSAATQVQLERPLRLYFQAFKPRGQAAGRGRSVSCSAFEKALARIKRLEISAVSPEDDKIMEMITNW